MNLWSLLLWSLGSPEGRAPLAARSVAAVGVAQKAGARQLKRLRRVHLLLDRLQASSSRGLEVCFSALPCVENSGIGAAAPPSPCLPQPLLNILQLPINIRILPP